MNTTENTTAIALHTPAKNIAVITELLTAALNEVEAQGQRVKTLEERLEEQAEDLERAENARLDAEAQRRRTQWQLDDVIKERDIAREVARGRADYIDQLATALDEATLERSRMQVQHQQSETANTLLAEMNITLRKKLARLKKKGGKR